MVIFYFCTARLLQFCTRFSINLWFMLIDHWTRDTNYTQHAWDMSLYLHQPTLNQKEKEKPAVAVSCQHGPSDSISIWSYHPPTPRDISTNPHQQCKFWDKLFCFSHSPWVFILSNSYSCSSFYLLLCFNIYFPHATQIASEMTQLSELSLSTCGVQTPSQPLQEISHSLYSGPTWHWSGLAQGFASMSWRLKA